ncbi:MAG: hypothetical protein J6J00_00430 [Treponema sp.]|nr:hypothetical protein [Treponema sp.]
MKKLSILAAFALSAALILSGCNPNAEDETADGTGTTTSGTETAVEGESSSGSESGEKDTSGSTDNSGDEQKDVATYALDFTKVNIANTVHDGWGGNDVASATVDGETVVKITLTKDKSYKIDVPAAYKDLSSKKLFKIAVKAGDDIDYHDSKLKFAYETDSTHGNEFTSGDDAGKFTNFLTDIPTDKFKEYTADTNYSWQSYNHQYYWDDTAKKMVENDSFGNVDFSNVTALQLYAQNVTGTLYIKYIDFAAVE